MQIGKRVKTVVIIGEDELKGDYVIVRGYGNRRADSSSVWRSD